MKIIKAEHFVRLWLEAYENGDGIQWVAGRMNRPASTINGMAQTLRNSGVELPSLRRRHIETIKVDDLNRLIAEKFRN